LNSLNLRETDKFERTPLGWVIFAATLERHWALPAPGDLP
jgi:hypothetical protein